MLQKCIELENIFKIHFFLTESTLSELRFDIYFSIEFNWLFRDVDKVDYNETDLLLSSLSHYTGHV